MDGVHPRVRHRVEAFAGTPPDFFVPGTDIEHSGLGRIGDPEHFPDVLRQLEESLLAFFDGEFGFQALSDVTEDDHGPCHRALLNDRGAHIFHRYTGAVLSPEDIARHTVDHAVVKGRIDRAVIGRIGAAVRPGMVEPCVHRLVDKFGWVISEHLSGGLIHEGGQAVAIQSVDAFPCLREDDFVQMAKAVENLFCLAPLSNVANDAAEKDGDIGFPHGQRQLDRELAAVLAQALQLDQTTDKAGLTGVLHAGEPSLVSDAIPLRHQHGQGLPADFVIGIPEQAGGGLIPGENMTVVVRQHDGVGGGLDQRSKSCFAFAQRVFGVLGFGGERLDADRPAQDGPQFVPVIGFGEVGECALCE